MYSIFWYVKDPIGAYHILKWWMDNTPNIITSYYLLSFLFFRFIYFTNFIVLIEYTFKRLNRIFADMYLNMERFDLLGFQQKILTWQNWARLGWYTTSGTVSVVKIQVGPISPRQSLPFVSFLVRNWLFFFYIILSRLLSAFIWYSVNPHPVWVGWTEKKKNIVVLGGLRRSS